MEEMQTNRVINVDLEKEMKQSFLDYSMSVIISRALPDVRDGLKPVHRRILYTMFENGLMPEKGYRKCADTVGAVLARYHPHGDASVYDALVRLAQDFSMRYMLVDGHGNFGSVDGGGGGGGAGPRACSMTRLPPTVIPRRVSASPPCACSPILKRTRSIFARTTTTV